MEKREIDNPPPKKKKKKKNDREKGKERKGNKKREREKKMWALQRAGGNFLFSIFVILNWSAWLGVQHHLRVTWNTCHALGEEDEKRTLDVIGNETFTYEGELISS